MPKFRQLLNRKSHWSNLGGDYSAKIQALLKREIYPSKFRVTSAEIQAILEERNSPFKI